jgi:hypothetical protein
MRPPHPLWGSILDSVALDLLQSGVRFELHRIDSTSEPACSRHTLKCLSVSDFQFRNAIPSPWNYAEITEIHARKISDKVSLNIMLWSEESEIAVISSQVLFDDNDAYQYLTDYRYAWSRHSA